MEGIAELIGKINEQIENRVVGTDTPSAPAAEEQTTENSAPDQKPEVVIKLTSNEDKQPKDEEKDAPTEADLEGLAFEIGYQDPFVKAVKEKYPDHKAGFDELRAVYTGIRKKLIAEGTWKDRPTNKARREAAKGKVSTPKPEAQPATVTPTVESEMSAGDQVLVGLACAARTEFHGAGGKIGAIRVVRDATSWELAIAKEFVEVVLESTEDNVTQELRNAITVLTLQFNVDADETTVPSLDAQIQMLRAEALKKEMDPDKGRAEGTRGKDLAGDKNQGLVQIARRVARELAVNGPITIDDITESMAARHNVLPEKGKRRHSWKGSVFTTSEWKMIGERPSRQASAHSRPVGLWALKTWLQTNTMNGRSTTVSSFVMSRLYTDFQNIHPGADFPNCNWYIGEERLSEEIRETITRDENKLYGAPVSFIPGAVGAMIMPPNPQALITSTAVKTG